MLSISDARCTNVFFEYLLLPLIPLSAYGSLRWLGLTTQIWGLFFGFPALAVGCRVVTKERAPVAARELAGDGSLLSVCAVSYFLTGYIVTISLAALLFVPHPSISWRRLWRLGWIGALTEAALAFLVLALLPTSENVLKSRCGVDSKWDSYGWQWAIGRLLNRGLFDDANLPIIPLLVALEIGLILVVLLGKRDHLQIWVLAGFVLWVLLFFGRASLGSFLDLLPMPSEIRDRPFPFLSSLSSPSGIQQLSVGFAPQSNSDPIPMCPLSGIQF